MVLLGVVACSAVRTIGTTSQGVNQFRWVLAVTTPPLADNQ